MGTMVMAPAMVTAARATAMAGPDTGGMAAGAVTTRHRITDYEGLSP